MRLAVEQRVLDDAEAEDDEDGGQHAERQRREAEDRVGAAEIEPHQDIGEAEAHQREQPLLDMARGVGQRVAAVERMADLEEHQQRPQTARQGRRRCARPGSSRSRLEHDSPAARKASAGHAVAEQQPVEDEEQCRRRRP